MLAIEFEHKARSAKIADRLLRIGVPAAFVSEAVDLTKREMSVILENLEKPPETAKGGVINKPESFILESVRRSISATVMISVYSRLKKNSPQLGYAELFAPTWNAFIAAIHPLTPGRLDVDIRQAWVLLRFVEDGTLKIGTCHCCGTAYPKIAGEGNKCIICSQISFTNCGGCGDKIERSHRLYDRKWRVGDLQATCALCRHKVDAKQARGTTGDSKSFFGIPL